VREETPAKKQIDAIKGTKDILPCEAGEWRRVEGVTKGIFELYGYRELRAPVFEATELFERGTGQTSDIVIKEMYTFKDKAGRSLTLRPEYTPSVVRSIIENRLYLQPEPMRYYYIGPMFRYDKPQKGRYRQFHQVDIEVFGEKDPAIDAEIIEMAHHLLKTLEVGETETLVNSVGCAACRPAYLRELRVEAQKVKEALCPDCQRKVIANPLRIFDCKVETCRELSRTFPQIINLSVSETLSRTILSSGATLLSFLAFFVWGTGAINPRRSGMVYAIDGRERWLVHNYMKPGEGDFDQVDRDACIRTILGVGADFKYDIISREDWYGRRLIANRFRDRSVFIAGDAAHIWVPYAGYGMNAGIADAMNLSWLLAAHLNGWAPSAILDAYEAERWPITSQVSRFAMSHAEAEIRRRGAIPVEPPPPQAVHRRQSPAPGRQGQDRHGTGQRLSRDLLCDDLLHHWRGLELPQAVGGRNRPAGPGVRVMLVRLHHLDRAGYLLAFLPRCEAAGFVRGVRSAPRGRGAVLPER
jgi:hypothetical protein